MRTTMKRLLLLSFALMASLGLFAQNGTDGDPDLQYATTLLAPGTPAPDFTLNDVDGKPVSIKDFLGKKVVLVFWASWCPDCREEIPLLKKMQAKVSPEKVAFVSVSFDRKEQTWKDFVRENQLGGVQLFDAAGKKDSTVGTDYGVKWIPALYLIDEKGKVQLGTVVAQKVADALN